jgi:transposase
MGSSRGGLTSRIHALVDAEGRRMTLALTAGQAGDAPAAAQMLPLVAPGATFIADRAYDTNAIRDVRPTTPSSRRSTVGCGRNV